MTLTMQSMMQTVQPLPSSPSDDGSVIIKMKPVVTKTVAATSTASPSNDNNNNVNVNVNINDSKKKSSFARWFGFFDSSNSRRKQLSAAAVAARGVYCIVASPLSSSSSSSSPLNDRHNPAGGGGSSPTASDGYSYSQKTIDSHSSYDSMETSNPTMDSSTATSSPIGQKQQQQQHQSSSTPGSTNNVKKNDIVWLPSHELNHNKGVPVVVRRPQYDSFNEPDDKKLLLQIIKKAKNLPMDSGKYASNHIMINSERIKRSIPPLTRDHLLDEIARDHATSMANISTLFHIDDPLSIQERIVKNATLSSTSTTSPSLSSSCRIDQTCGRIGENTFKGKTLVEIHDSMMASLGERNNILDKRFSHMGMGSARAVNGTLYLCQVFTG
jgi:uncharacterized protein YkwD